MRPVRPTVFGRLVEFTSIPRLRSLEVFASRLRTGLSTVKPSAWKIFTRTKLKDQSMKKIQLLMLVLAGFVVTSRAADGFADSVVSYDPGTGYVAGFTNVSAVL